MCSLTYGASVSHSYVSLDMRLYVEAVVKLIMCSDNCNCKGSTG